MRAFLRRFSPGLVGLGAILLASLFAIAPDTYVADQVISDFRLFDRSWAYDLPTEFLAGRAVGREYIFNYGVLYQLTHATGFYLGDGDLASMVRFHELVETLISVTLIWLLMCATGAPLGWRLMCLAAWTVFVAAPWDFHATHLKPMLGLGLVAGAGYFLGRAIERPKSLWSLAALGLWGVSGPLLTLYSFELGILAVADLLGLSLLLLLMSFRIQQQEASRVRWMTLLVNVAIGLGVGLFVGTVSWLPAWNRYLPYTWELAVSYADAMALPGGDTQYLVLVGIGFVLLGVIVVLIRDQRALWRDSIATDGAILMLLAAAGMSGLLLRYALTRSDWSHVFRAAMPSVVVLGLLLPCWLISRAVGNGTAALKPDSTGRRFPLRFSREGARGAALALLLLSVVPFSLTETFGSGWSLRLTRLSQMSWAPAQVRISDESPFLIDAVQQAEQLPDPFLYVWPYEAIVNVLADKRNPAYLFHSTSAYTPRLERETIAQLEAIDDLPVMLFRNSLHADSVSNMTRVPRIFRYLLDRYELEGEPHEAFALLRRVPDQQRGWTTETVPLSHDKDSFVPVDQATLQVPLIGIRASDLLLLKLNAAEPNDFTIPAVGKPGIFIAIFALSDGLQRQRRFLLPSDGQSHEVLISACDLDDPLFLSNFVPDRQWRSREEVLLLAIYWAPMDRLSRRPASITLEGISVLRRHAAEEREIPLSGQENRAVQDWFFRIAP
jgi:hypothetical protein